MTPSQPGRDAHGTSPARRGKGRGNPAAPSAQQHAIAWRPTPAMKLHLAAQRDEPGLSAKARCKRLGLAFSAWCEWCRNDRFLEWWNAQLLEQLGTEIGPLLSMLRGLALDTRMSAKDRIRATEVLLEQLSGGDPRSLRKASAIAVLEAFTQSRPGARAQLRAARKPDGTEVLEASIEDAHTQARQEEQGREGVELGVLVATPAQAQRIARTVHATEAVIAEALSGAQRARDNELVDVPDSPADPADLHDPKKRQRYIRGIIGTSESNERAEGADSDEAVEGGEGVSKITPPSSAPQASHARSSLTRGAGVESEETPHGESGALLGAGRSRGDDGESAPEAVGPGAADQEGHPAGEWRCDECGAGREVAGEGARCARCGVSLAGPVLARGVVEDHGEAGGALPSAAERGGGAENVGVVGSDSSQGVGRADDSGAAPAAALLKTAGVVVPPRRIVGEDFRCGLPTGGRAVEEAERVLPR